MIEPVEECRWVDFFDLERGVHDYALSCGGRILSNGPEMGNRICVGCKKKVAYKTFGDKNGGIE